MNWTAERLAAHVGGQLEGDGSTVVSGLSGLSEAGRGEVSFLANPRYAALVGRTRASVVIVARDWRGACSAPALIRVESPDRAFVAAAAVLAPPPPARAPGVHPTAVVDPGAVLGRDVHVGPCTVIEKGAQIGDRTVIEAQCYVGCDVRIGPDGHLYPQVAVRERTRIGARAILHCGVVVGADGFGYLVEPRPGGLPRVEKIPQVGIVEIGDDVEIGANATIDRARFGRTRIGNGVKIDNLVQIAHNVQVGDCSGIVAQAGIAGSSKIGAGVMVWAQAGIAGHLEVADGAQVGPQAGVSKDVPAGEFVLGAPAVPKREFVMGLAVPRQVERLKARVADLEARLAALEKLQPGQLTSHPLQQ
jgi:UDP-3-O-[3-hydroxymyristoyl] glucosamine N-acyltransferase